MRLSRALLWGLLATVLLTVLSPIITPLLVLPPAATGQAFGAGWTIIAALAVGLGCAAVYENGRTPRLMLSGIAASMIAGVGWVLMIFLSSSSGIMYWIKPLVWPSTWAGFAMLTGLLMLVPARDELRLWSRRVAIGMLAIFALYLCLAYAYLPDQTFRRSWEYEEYAVRYGAALALLAGGGFLGALLIGWLSWVSGSQRPETDPVPYRILCPRCGSNQQLQTGHAACSGCGLRVRLEVS